MPIPGEPVVFGRNNKANCSSSFCGPGDQVVPGMRPVGESVYGVQQEFAPGPGPILPPGVMYEEEDDGGGRGGGVPIPPLLPLLVPAAVAAVEVVSSVISEKRCWLYAPEVRTTTLSEKPAGFASHIWVEKKNQWDAPGGFVVTYTYRVCWSVLHNVEVEKQTSYWWKALQHGCKDRLIGKEDPTVEEEAREPVVDRDCDDWKSESMNRTKVGENLWMNQQIRNKHNHLRRLYGHGLRLIPNDDGRAGLVVNPGAR